jgi:hypothetical protein
MLELGCARVPPGTPAPSLRLELRVGAPRVGFRDRPAAYPETEKPRDVAASRVVCAWRQAPRGFPVAMSTTLSIPSRTAVSPAPRPAPTRSLPRPRGGGGRRSEREGHVPRQARELCRARTPRRAPCSDAADRRAGRPFIRGPSASRLAVFPERLPVLDTPSRTRTTRGRRARTRSPRPPAGEERRRSGRRAPPARVAPREAPRAGPGARLPASACGCGGLFRGAARRGGRPPRAGGRPPRRPRLAPRRPRPPPPPRPRGGAAAALTHDERARARPPRGRAARPRSPRGRATWLILPVVICLSQRLSHACVSMN